MKNGVIMKNVKTIIPSCALVACAFSMNSCFDSGPGETVVNPYAREFRVRLASMTSLPDSDLVLTAWMSSHMLTERSWMLIYPSPQAVETFTIDAAPEDLPEVPNVQGPAGPTSMQVIDPTGVVEINGKKFRMEAGKAAIWNRDGSITLLRHPANVYMTWFAYHESLIQDKREPSDDLGPVWEEELKRIFESFE